MAANEFRKKFKIWEHNRILYKCFLSTFQKKCQCIQRLTVTAIFVTKQRRIESKCSTTGTCEVKKFAAFYGTRRFITPCSQESITGPDLEIAALWRTGEEFETLTVVGVCK
jgi:hypothetical protein